MTICGHFRFTIQSDIWLLCSDCECGIRADYGIGRRMLERKQGLNRLDPQQLSAYRSLQDSYRDLCTAAGTNDPDEIQAYLERQHNG